MSTKQGEIRVSNIKHTQALIKDRKDRDDTIVKLKREIEDYKDTVAGLTTENGELTLKLDKYKKAQEDGYLAVAEDKDGMIVHIAEVQGYSKYTYLQEIPEVIGTEFYKKRPYYKLVENKMVIDTQKLKIYKLGGLL